MRVKLILPAPGQERASLPQLVDGRPQFTGPRPVLRDYTPAHSDAAQGSLDIEVALHDAGPASDWAAAVQVGQWAGIAGPRGSLVIPVGFDWHWLLGDETALPAIARRLAELPATARAVVRVQLRNPQDQRALASAAQLDVAWVDSLTDAAQALAVPAGPGYIWAAGEHSEMAALRGMLAAKPGDFPPGSEITLYTVGPRDADTWTFVVEAEEKLQLPAGEFTTVKLTRKPRREYDQKVEIWYAPSLGYLPVRNRITQQNDDFIDQNLSEIIRPL